MTTVDTFDPETCDLCGSSDWSALPLHDTSVVCGATRAWPRDRSASGSAAFVDWRVMGTCSTPLSLAQHYGDAYQLNAVDDACEHQFVRDGQWVTRSAAMAHWMREALSACESESPIESIYEVGAGQGRLLTALGAHYPNAALAGCEPNRQAAAAARRQGQQIEAGDERSITGTHDLVVASFVLRARAISDAVPAPPRRPSHRAWPRPRGAADAGCREPRRLLRRSPSPLRHQTHRVGGEPRRARAGCLASVAVVCSERLRARLRAWARHSGRVVCPADRAARCCR